MFYIQSKGRPAAVAKNVVSALATKMPVAVCVERYELSDYRREMNKAGIEKGRVTLIPHKGRDQGLSYARRTALRHARKMGWNYIVLADDDFRYPENIQQMIGFLAESGRSGIGVYRSLYGHFMGMKKGTGVHDVYNCMGMGIIAVNVETMFEVGAFANRIPTHEDADMLLRLIREGLGPWCIHSDCEAVSLAPRNAPGGQTTMAPRLERERIAYEMFCEEFGSEFFSFTKRGIRTQWKKVYQKLGGVYV